MRCRRCSLCNGFKFTLDLKSTEKITLCFSYRKAWWFQLHIGFSYIISTKLERKWSLANYSDQRLISLLTADKALIQNGLKHDAGAQAFWDRKIWLQNSCTQWWEDLKEGNGFGNPRYCNLGLSLSMRKVGPRYIQGPSWLLARLVLTCKSWASGSWYSSFEQEQATGMSQPWGL